MSKNISEDKAVLAILEGIINITQKFNNGELECVSFGDLARAGLNGLRKVANITEK